jgi:tetratricopeptide (TPR) repeat protein
MIKKILSKILFEKKTNLFISIIIIIIIFNIFFYYGNRFLPSYETQKLDSLIKNQKFDVALKKLKVLHSEKPNDFLINKYLGKVYLLTDNYDSAQIYLKKAYSIRKDNEIIQWQNLIGISGLNE